MRPRTIQPPSYLRLCRGTRTTRSVTEPALADSAAVPTCNHQRREIAPGGADTDYVAARPVSGLVLVITVVLLGAGHRLNCLGAALSPPQSLGDPPVCWTGIFWS
jgi:hypothetical protein